MPAVVNISGYEFVALVDLPALRQRLLACCRAGGLRGTILLSTEGINVFVAGGREPIDKLLQKLRAIPGLENFMPKESLSDDQPFNRMLVRIKREIIAFGVPGIEPQKRTSPKLAPQELKRWLDEKRPVTLLDTRNDYEVRAGTFQNAVTLGLDHFRNFPAAAQKLPDELKREPIVMFCTGGIRCEKAGPYLEREGFEHVYQLEGGILKYFEECGSAHYDGDCFVFDRRIGLDPSLAETGATQCFNCRAPLSASELADPHYVEGRSCPQCYLSDAEQMRRIIVDRERAIERATTPLPGSTPYENIRPLNISALHDGQTLLETVLGIFPHLPPAYWHERFAAGLLVDQARQPVAPDRRVRAGERYLHRFPATREPDVCAAIRVLHEDEALVVVQKPAPLPMHPSGRYNRNTLQWILNCVYHPQKLRPIHRLDANTTGIAVFARTQHFARQLQSQFAAGDVQKRYLARIQGQPAAKHFHSDAAIARCATTLGARAIDDDGQTAHTDFTVLRHFADGTTLVEAIPTTGRTNQIRAHLWELGHPIVGDQAYLPHRRHGETQTHAPSDPPLCLHAEQISFCHPLTKQYVTFQSARPAWVTIE
jgi:RluA family pseudouridine synthase